MALHLIKLAVGAAEVGNVIEWSGRRPRSIVHTRQTPKRAAELLEGGSLYWVVKGVILIRQPIIGVDTIGESPNARCEIELDRAAVLTAPQPRRAFQGWRYLTAQDAPPDLPQDLAVDMPQHLAKQLRDLGAW